VPYPYPVQTVGARLYAELPRRSHQGPSDAGLPWRPGGPVRVLDVCVEPAQRRPRVPRQRFAGNSSKRRARPNTCSPSLFRDDEAPRRNPRAPADHTAVYVRTSRNRSRSDVSFWPALLLRSHLRPESICDRAVRRYRAEGRSRWHHCRASLSCCRYHEGKSYCPARELPTFAAP